MSYSIKSIVHPLSSLNLSKKFEEIFDTSRTSVKKVLFSHDDNDKIPSIYENKTSKKFILIPRENDETQIVIQEELATEGTLLNSEEDNGIRFTAQKELAPNKILFDSEKSNIFQSIAPDEIVHSTPVFQYRATSLEKMENINSFYDENLGVEIIPEYILPEVQYEVTIAGSERSVSPSKTESLPDLNNYKNSPYKQQTLETQLKNQQTQCEVTIPIMEESISPVETESVLTLEAEVVNKVSVLELERSISPVKVEPAKENQGMQYDVTISPTKVKSLPDVNDNLSPVMYEEEKLKYQGNFAFVGEKSETTESSIPNPSEDSPSAVFEDGFEFTNCHDFKEAEKPLPLIISQKKKSIKSVKFQTEPIRYSKRLRDRSIGNSKIENFVDKDSESENFKSKKPKTTVEVLESKKARTIEGSIPEELKLENSASKKRKEVTNYSKSEDSRCKKSKFTVQSSQYLEPEKSEAAIEDPDLENSELENSIDNKNLASENFKFKNPELQNFEIQNPDIAVQNFEYENFDFEKQKRVEDSKFENSKFEIPKIPVKCSESKNLVSEKLKSHMDSEAEEPKTITENSVLQDVDFNITQVDNEDQKLENIQFEISEHENINSKDARLKNSKPEKPKTIWKICNFIKKPRLDSQSTILKLRLSKRICEDSKLKKPEKVKKSIEGSESKNLTKNLQKSKLESEGYRPKRSKITVGFRFKKTRSRRRKISESKVMCPHKNCDAYLTKNYLRQHIKVVHNNQRSQCDFCSKIVGPSHIRSHEKLCEQNKARITVRNFVCSIKDCLASFKTSAEVYRHTWHVHRKPEPCPIKGCHSLVKPAGMKKHIRACHEATPMAECPHCGKELKKKSLNQHIRGCAMPTNERNFKCTVKNCSATFRMQHEVNGHLWRVHQEQVQCPMEGCTKIMNPIHLERHIKFAHDKVKVKCQKCGKLMAECSLPGHWKTCSGLSKYKCSKKGCKKVFKISSELAQHVDQEHHSAFPCQYEGCDRIFLRQSVLNRHEKVIHKKPIEICPYCEKEVRASYLYKHKMICNNKSTEK